MDTSENSTLPSVENKSIWDKILRISILLTIFLAPIFFLPLTNSPLYLNKQVFLIILTLLIFVLWIFRFIVKGQTTISFGLLFFSLLALLVGLSISSYFSISFLDAIRVEAQPLSLILMAALIFFSFFLASEITGGLNIKIPFFLIISGIILIVINAFFQIFGFFIFPFEFTKNINFDLSGSHNISALLAAAILISLATYLTFGKNLAKLQKIFLNIIFAILFLYLILINYQIIWYLLALFSVGIIIAYFAGKKEEGLVNLRKLISTIIICAVSIFFIITKDPFAFIRPELSPEISPSFSVTASVLQNVFKEGTLRFIFGSGPATFAYNWDLYKPQAINETAFWNAKFFGGYSTAMTFLIENGVVGGLTLLFFVVSFIICSFKLLKGIKEKIIPGQSALILSSSLIGGLFLLISWFLYPPNFVINLVLFIFLGILWGGATSYYRKCQRVLKFPEKVNYAVIFVLVSIVLMVFGISALYIEGNRYAAAIYFSKSQDVLNKEGNIDKAMDYTSKAIMTDKYEDSYPRFLSGIILAALNQTAAGADAKGLEALVSNAVNAGKRAVLNNSADYLNWNNLGQVYANLIPLTDSVHSFAISSYLEAQKRNPKNPSIYLNMARVKMIDFNKLSQPKPSKKDMAALENLKKSALEQAIKYIDSAIALKDDYVDARYFLGLIFDEVGKKSQAIEQFENIQKLSPGDIKIKKILENLRAKKPALFGISNED